MADMNRRRAEADAPPGASTGASGGPLTGRKGGVVDALQIFGVG